MRFQAGQRFAAGEKTSVTAQDLRVSVRSVERWRRQGIQQSRHTQLPAETRYPAHHP
ncbi:helix-turn-helix domain-containing protein [Streptomyces sp. ME01-18a]|uniref:helix-turn-helix domain-containing protein n=1 Tax=Streptomyces sp. ME01-18a TaxID=3028669 RepID=UPI0039F6C913